jgi:CheY-like chemotaxis protein
VESLGGEIRLFSTPGEGTLFRVNFPNITIKKPVHHAAEEEGAPPEDVPDWRDRYVLIAEDERSNFDLLEAILAKTKIRIRHAWTGREAVTMCREGEQPDLLLMDLRMPDLDGLSALKEIRSIYPGIPAIAQTAFAMADERHRCLQSGFDDYLAKPIRASLLLEKMGRVLEKE